MPSPRLAPVRLPSLPLPSRDSWLYLLDRRADVSLSFGFPEGACFFGNPPTMARTVRSPALGIDLPRELPWWLLRSIGACDAAVGPLYLPGSESEDRDASI